MLGIVIADTGQQPGSFGAGLAGGEDGALQCGRHQSYLRFDTEPKEVFAISF